ncbi:NDR1/HIN1-like protein 6 [Phoenix dactylifera]|uniref:NDR1/HIN1-like protein 6 n=1 Tax=Phoenix dactylifera TaxID=42345 RepID=A0A8B7BIK0_PHODC|nr:NDR1/HIN1-like protein 6 [Phoenix dactylifera]
MPSSPPQMSPKINSPPYHFQLPDATTRQMKPEFEAPPRKNGLLRPRQRTNPMIWCAAVLCVIFSLLLIFAGIVTLIVFLVIKPRNPLFDTTSASLNSIYLDSPSYLNGDLTFLANFSNPNHKIDVMFEYSSIELYFYDRLLSAQALQPFAQRRGESRLESVHMISSEVYLPPELIMELQEQVRRNRIVYNIRGTFKVKVSVGVGHLSYWLYGRCQIELTAPPSGVLVARSCRTKK